MALHTPIYPFGGGHDALAMRYAPDTAISNEGPPWSQAGVNHDNDQCLNGQAIPLEHRTEGIGVYDPSIKSKWWHTREVEQILASMPPDISAAFPG